MEETDTMTVEEKTIHILFRNKHYNEVGKNDKKYVEI